MRGFCGTFLIANCRKDDLLSQSAEAGVTDVENRFLWDLLKVSGGFLLGLLAGYLMWGRRAPARERPTLNPNFPNFTETGIVQVLTFLSQTHRSIHNERIKRELKIVITTLSFYGAVAGLKLSGKLTRNDVILYIVSATLFALARSLSIE
jgi:uncharacterized membrane protein YfcA